ncbi:unnamed protein product [Orchesella dallaii]|uniref:F-box domain-containing protein n=1 Tax=Orchesella dallaii TaxID=48710 RepID=A0ABP1R5I9_9HEXA
MATDMMPFPMANVEPVWMMIFEMLDDESKIAFANSCPIWHGWVQDKIEPLLLAKIAPLLRPYVTLRTLMDLRLVSSKTCNSIDNALALHPCNVWMDYESSALQNKSIPKIRTTFRSNQHIRRFLRQMSEISRNPFPSKSVIFVFENGWEYMQSEQANYSIGLNFWRECTRMLEKFGSFVEHIEFGYVFPKILDTRLGKSLSDCLRLVPNLKSLALNGNLDDWTTHVNGYYDQYRLPELLQLESLSMSGMGQIISEKILRYCCSPEKLTRLTVTRLDELRMLEQVYRFSELYVLRTMSSSEDLSRLGNQENAPKLREFHCGEILYSNTTPGDDLGSLRSLQPFSATLFNISMSRNFYAGNFQGNFVFPNVTMLSFGRYRGSLDVLLKFSALKYLKIGQLVDSEPQGSVVSIDPNRVLDSTIWKMIPTLITLVFGKQKYMRHNTTMVNQHRNANVNCGITAHN